MFEEQTIKKLKWLWLTICSLIALLTVQFPIQERTEEIELWMFALIAIAFLMAWFLMGIFLFSNFGPSIVRSMPSGYRRKYAGCLFFLKFFTTKEAYKEVQALLKEINSPKSCL